MNTLKAEKSRLLLIEGKNGKNTAWQKFISIFSLEKVAKQFNSFTVKLSPRLLKVFFGRKYTGNNGNVYLSLLYRFQ